MCRRRPGPSPARRPLAPWTNSTRHRWPRLSFSRTHGAHPLHRYSPRARPGRNRSSRGESPTPLVGCRAGRQVGDRASGRDTRAVRRPTRSDGQTSVPRQRHGGQRDAELPTTGAVGRAVAARSAAVVGPVHLERDTAPRGMERGSPVPRYMAVRHPAGRVGVDDQCRLGVGDLRCRAAHIPAPARLLSARVAAGRVDVHLHRVHERPSRAHRPGGGHELRPLDAACRPRARSITRATRSSALDRAAGRLRRPCGACR